MESTRLKLAGLMVGAFTLSLLMVGLQVGVRSAHAAAPTQPTKIQFYMYIAVQNISYLDNPAPYTAIRSATPGQSNTSAFGDIHTFDNPLTTTPSLNNPLTIGHVQGWYGNTGRSVLTLFLVQTFSFTTKRYNGTLSLLGIDVATDALKYAPIIGGTGDFAFARGVATQTLVSTNNIDGRTVSWFHYSLDLKY